MSTRQLLTDFYSSFRDRDFAGMARCYHPDVRFHDPVFEHLKGREVPAMWQMLVTRGKETKISFEVLEADEKGGRVRWEAVYPYGPKRRRVHNVVESRFEIREGKIVDQVDTFDFRRWLGMALGPAGRWLGWTPVLKAMVRRLARKSLLDFMHRSR